MNNARRTLIVTTDEEAAGPGGELVSSRTAQAIAEQAAFQKVTPAELAARMLDEAVRADRYPRRRAGR